MRYITALLLLSLSASAQKTWQTIRHYDKNHTLNIALPLGGIGTGTFSLGGRGELRDWQIMNKPGIGFSTVTDGNQAPFFSIYVRPRQGKASAKALLGPLHPSEYSHYEGRPVNHHGMPRFSSATFDAAYPFGRVQLEDDILPVSVQIEGFNPFIPGDIPASSLPVGILTYHVTNQLDKPIDVAICGTLRNFIGIDGSRQSRNWKGDFVYHGASHNQNTFRQHPQFQGIYMHSDSVKKDDPAWGTLALVTTEKDSITYRRSSRNNDWENAILDFWDDFSHDGRLTDKDRLIDHNPMASLAVKKTIPAKSKASFRFFIAWHFPNRTDWNNAWNFGYKGTIIGNHYTTQYRDAWDVLEKEIPTLPERENKTIRFVNTIAESNLPDVIKESALFNLSTLRSQTVFRLPSGHLMGWEGVMDEAGSCYGNCTHVWNYETATAFLFGDLARSMREVELNYGTKPNGKMMNRVYLPLEKNLTTDHVAAADGQMGSVMRCYREWKLSGNHAWLATQWLKIKAAMSYAWVNNGWDADADGVQEGQQHNTMDVDYFGPNPQMQFWYFGALKASAEMAKHMQDTAFSNRCLNILSKGRQWVDKNLFNGEYYEHHITDPKTKTFININDPKTAIPDFQLGRGCLVDQLAGQYMAHICGLGYLADSLHIRKTLQTIMKYNFIDRFDNIFNNMRSYVMDRESGLIMASWPKGRLKVPFPYFAESMSGFEYTAAIGMIYEGQTANGLKCIQSIRNRFDGEKRNPFDEPECGHHYARAMASWSAIPALSGFQYSGINQSIQFTSKPGKYFWSNGYAWGSAHISDTGNKKILTLQVEHGDLTISSVTLAGMKSVTLQEPAKVGPGNEWKLVIP